MEKIDITELGEKYIKNKFEAIVEIAEKVNEIIDHLNKPKCTLCQDPECNIERHFYASGPQVTPGTGGNTILTGQ